MLSNLLYTWKIWGTDYVTMEKLPTLTIRAGNFGLALIEARKIHPDYCSGQRAD